MRKALTAALVSIGAITSAQAGSIQQPGLTTGLAEGFGFTEGLYSVTALNFGWRDTAPAGTDTTTFIPTFLTWSTPWDLAGGHLMFKAAPIVHVDMDMGNFNASSTYSPYYGAWLSWYLGNGLNLAIGEGYQVGLSTKVNRTLARDFTAFQQNIALSYVKDNWNITANSFFTEGRNDVNGSQPRTANIDFTAIKRDGRMEYGLVAFGQQDLNKPSVGYGDKQSEVAVGGLIGYLFGNQVSAQVKLTRDIQQRNLGGYETRLWFQVIVPIFTPPAPTPRNAY